GGQFFDALDGEDVVRSGIALDDIIALLNDVAILKVNVLALRDEIFLWFITFARRLDGDAAFVLVVFAEPHRAANLGDDRCFFRTPRLEQLRHPRQTAGDVASLGTFSRDTRNHVARLHVTTRIDRDDRVDGRAVTALHPRGEVKNLVARLDQDCRTQV